MLSKYGIKPKDSYVLEFTPSPGMGVNFAYRRVHSEILHMSQDSKFRSLDPDTLYVSIYSKIIQQIMQIMRILKTPYDFF